VTCFKSVLAGFVAALVASVLYILAVFVVPIAFELLRSRMAADAGSAGIGAISVGFTDVSVLGVSLVAFAAGFTWQFRRASRAR
jgi:hypothetical protein